MIRFLSMLLTMTMAAAHDPVTPNFGFGTLLNQGTMKCFDVQKSPIELGTCGTTSFGMSILYDEGTITTTMGLCISATTLTPHRDPTCDTKHDYSFDIIEKTGQIMHDGKCLQAASTGTAITWENCVDQPFQKWLKYVATPAPSPAPAPAPAIVTGSAVAQTRVSNDKGPHKKPHKPHTQKKHVVARTASSSGDPHFLTFSGAKFDFHGGCDLVLLHHKGFDNDLGLDIHIRTRIQTWWSHISQAVLRIGPDTLEVMGGEDGGPYWLNGQPGDLLNDGAKFSIAGYPVIFRSKSLKQNQFRIELGNGDAISMETYKSFVRVNLNVRSSANFVGATGMMGSYPSGKMLARDGLTVMEDNTNVFGKEWQVRSSEPNLFHDTTGVQHPTECAMPNTTISTEKRRRLGEALVSKEDATVSCAHVDSNERDACIFDVLATNDKDMAGSY